MADTMDAGRVRDGRALLVGGGEVMIGTVGGRRGKNARHCGYREGKGWQALWVKRGELIALWLQGRDACF